jgi:demethylmenaquinone methyltransferase/2-methoxy-6-polyprenyl-1,4-benzoquinol methylase
VTVEELLAEQRRYYAARAPEYEDWWWRRGRYSLDAEDEERWFADVAEVERALRALAPLGDVLELAAGTGIWTRQLVPLAGRVVAVDANAETLALNDADAEHVVADVFAWEPEEQFDACLFAFWISHVPVGRFAEFWTLVRRAVRPGGRVFLVDGAVGGREPGGEEELRTLNDGREFRIVKRFWTPAELAELVRPFGFELDLRESANGQFLYGSGS